MYRRKDLLGSPFQRFESMVFGSATLRCGDPVNQIEGKVKAVHLKASRRDRRGDWGPSISGCALVTQFLSHNYLFEILFPSNSTQCSEIIFRGH